MAIDFGRMHSTRSKLQGAIDAAVLAAASPQIQELPQAQQIKRAKDTFYANCFNAICSQLKTLTIKNNDGVITGTVAIDVPTTFMSVAGIKSTEVKVTSEVSVVGGFENVYLTLDLSSSMGVASTPAGRTKLKQITRNYMPRNYYADGSPSTGCLYACHTRDGWEPRGQTLYQLAKANNIAIREDVLVQQMSTISNKLVGAGVGSGGQLKVGVIAFSDEMQVLLNPTTDLSKLTDPLSRLTIRRENTRYKKVMRKITRKIGNAGDGSSASSPRKTMIMMTDGVDVDKNDNSKAFDSKYCKSLKSSGVRVIVINIKYVKDPGNYLYELLVAPFYDKIEPNLKACATKGEYYEATDTDDIVTTFDVLTNNILAGQTRLTR